MAEQLLPPTAENYNFYQETLKNILSSEESKQLKEVDNTFFLYLIHEWIGINETSLKSGTTSEIRKFFDHFKFPRYMDPKPSGVSLDKIFCPFDTKHKGNFISMTSLMDKATAHQWACENDNSIRLECDKTECRFYAMDSFRKCKTQSPNIWIKRGTEYILVPSHKEHLFIQVLKRKKVDIGIILKLLYQKTDEETYTKFLEDFNFKEEQESLKFFKGELLTKIKTIQQLKDDSSTISSLDGTIHDEDDEELREELEIEQIKIELQTDLCAPVQLNPEQIKFFIQRKAIKGIDDNLICRISSSLNSGKHIILTGPPGTGKSKIAEAICTAAKQSSIIDDYKVTTATSEWTTFETIGSYFPMSTENSNVKLEFSSGILLENFSFKYINLETRTNYWHIIDEINRAQIDKAFGPFFTLFAKQKVLLPFRGKNLKQIEIIPAIPENIDEIFEKLIELTTNENNTTILESNVYIIPEKWRLIGTMNCYDKGFLFKLSNAFLRRFSIIPVDIPKLDDYKGLIVEYIITQNSEGLFNESEIRYLSNRITMLLYSDDELSSLQKVRKIGPAITIDMINYIFTSQNRFSTLSSNVEDTSNGSERRKSVINVLICDSILMFILPQFQDVDLNQVSFIYKNLLVEYDCDKLLFGYLKDNSMIVGEDID